MDRLFRIDFYPSEWVLQTGKMTPVQRGIFIQIVAMIYANRGPIENDPAYIGRASNCSARLARSVVEQLYSMDSIQIEGSKITQRRCERELNIKRSHLENSAKGGRNANQTSKASINNNELSKREDLKPPPSSLAIATPTALQKRASKADTKQTAKSPALPPVCETEVLPSGWQDLAEGCGIPDDQIFRSWRRFKEISVFPYKLDNWTNWIARERVGGRPEEAQA